MRTSIIAVLLAFIVCSFKSNQTALTLTGTSQNGNAVLTWTFVAPSEDPDEVIDHYQVRRKENSGNLKNYYATIAVLPGDQTSFSVPLQKGQNTFQVYGVAVDGTGYLTDPVTVK